MARSTEKAISHATRTLLLIAAMWCFAAPAAWALKFDEMSLDRWAKLGEADRYQLNIAEKYYRESNWKVALAEYERLFGRPLVDTCPIDPDTGALLPVLTIVTDNGGPFRSFTFEAFIATHPELAHVRTRVRSPGQNGSRERGFGTLKYERLYIDQIDDALMLAERAEDYRIEYNTVRPHEAIAWNRPEEVHLGLADPTIPTFQTTENLPTT